MKVRIMMQSAEVLVLKTDSYRDCDAPFIVINLLNIELVKDFFCESDSSSVGS
jgi:hypothetical protein